MATTRIPCVSCRVETSAEAGSVAVSCSTCGISLPPPDARAWHLMRGSGQFGPYTVAELYAYIAEGRIQPADNVWHDGAAVRIAVRQLPSRDAAPTQPPTPVPDQPQPLQPGPAPVAAAPASFTAAPVETASVATPADPQPSAPVQAASPMSVVVAAPQGGKAALHIRRALNWDLRSLPVEPDEEERLLANGVDEVDARRYLVWRRSVLLVVAIPTLVSALLRAIGVLGGDYTSITALGVALEYAGLAALFAMPITAWLAARVWDQHRRSRTILLRGWLFSFLTPLFLALVPFTWRVDMSQADVTQLATLNVTFSLVGAMAVYVTLMPAVLSLIPGVLRGCLRIKALIPESILPGLFLVAATPLYILLFLVIFTTINQVAGNFLLIAGVVALVGAPMLYLINARTFTRPLRTDEEIARIGSVQQMVLVIMGIGLALIVVYAFTAEIFGQALIGTDEQTSMLRPWSPGLFQFPIEYFVRSLFTTVLVADLFMLMNLQLWKHTKEFQASPDAESYDRLMVEIEEAGGGGPRQNAA